MTWDAGDANWVAKVDVSGSSDGRTYTPIPSLQNVDQYKKWGTQLFPLAQPFEARYLRFRYHNNGVKATVIRMPTAIGVYFPERTAGELLEIPRPRTPSSQPESLRRTFRPTTPPRCPSPATRR